VLPDERQRLHAFDGLPTPDFFSLTALLRHTSTPPMDFVIS
jgi:hypothetical protein